MAARSSLALVALAALLAVAHSAAPPAPAPPSSAPRFINLDPWAWLPTRRTKSASIMDYFFPPSRTPKVSNLESSPSALTSPAPTERASTPTSTADRAAPTTVQDAHTTIASRKTSAAAKTKTSAPHTTPKLKSGSKITTQHYTGTETRTTKVEKAEKQTTAVPSSSKVSATRASTTQRPTKHYTIMPVRSTATPPSTDEYTHTTLDTATQTSVTLDTTETDKTSPPEYATGTTVRTTLSVMVESAQTSQAAAAPTSTRVTAGESRATAGTTHAAPDTTATETSLDSTTEAADNSTATDELDSREGYLPLRDKPHQTHVKINDQTKKETVPLPAGSTSVLAKPTKYHYYPHNQHIYLLPECAIQQVCNAVYVRLNYTQPLCACPSRYRDPCSASLNADDLHTTRLTTDSKKKYAARAVTLVKTCEAVSEMRECRAPRDWSLLALQNIRTGKSHYLVICRCPENHILEGPMSHDQPTYASVPGIRVYGMMCVRPAANTQYQTAGYNANRYTAVSIQTTTSAYKVDYSQPHYNQEKPMYTRYPSHSYLGPNPYYNRMNRAMRTRRDVQRDYPPFPWHKVRPFAHTIDWDQ